MWKYVPFLHKYAKGIPSLPEPPQLDRLFLLPAMKDWISVISCNEYILPHLKVSWS